MSSATFGRISVILVCTLIPIWAIVLANAPTFQIVLPPIETQRQIVEELDRQMQALEGVRLLKSEAGKWIEEILVGMWGEKIT